MLVIIVGGIPIAMPTVLSVTLALGAFKLAKEGAIVARMSAVEEMAGQSLKIYSCHGSFCPLACMSAQKVDVQSLQWHLLTKAWPLSCHTYSCCDVSSLLALLSACLLLR